MSHTFVIENWKGNSDQNMSLGALTNLARTMVLRMMRLYMYYVLVTYGCMVAVYIIT
jgi:hypothetical protein